MNNAEKLKSFRLKHNLTQQQLADLLGVSQQIITYIETGKREPSDSFKLAFLRHYKVDFDELDLENNKQNRQKRNEIMKILVALYDIFHDSQFEDAIDLFRDMFYKYRNHQHVIERNYEICHNRLVKVDDIIKELKTKNATLEEENKELKLVIKKMIRE
jgi:putative transcriptional regulator